MGKGYKGRNPRGAKAKDDDEEGSGGEAGEKNFTPNQRGLGQQSDTVGMLPPSDSESEYSDEEKPADEAGKPADEAEKPAAEGESSKPKPKAAPKPAKKAPNSDDDSSSDDDEEEEHSNVPEYFRGGPKKKEPVRTEPDPEQVRKDLERLEMIRAKREGDRQKRIATEGWDRFGAVTATNFAPGTKPPDN